jgi:hypothetical protein
MVTHSSANQASDDMSKAAIITRYFASFGVKEGTFPDDFVGQFDQRAIVVFTETTYRGRWQAQMFDVYKLTDGSFLGVEYMEGLTEYQDSTGVTDVYKVEPREIVTFEYYKV